LSDKTKTRDWYLYKNYTKIRLYGCELAPSKLPKYVPMRILSLEYIRQVFNMDEIHFVLGKRKSELKIKNQVGPSICNNRIIGDDANLILKQFHFQPSVT